MEFEIRLYSRSCWKVRASQLLGRCVTRWLSLAFSIIGLAAEMFVLASGLPGRASRVQDVYFVLDSVCRSAPYA